MITFKITCQICSKEFNTKKKTQKFCSNTCRGKSMSIGKWEITKCENCGKDFKRRISKNYTTGKLIRFCSRECFRKSDLNKENGKINGLRQENPFNNLEIQKKIHEKWKENRLAGKHKITNSAPQLLKNAYARFREQYQDVVEFLFSEEEYKGYLEYYSFKCKKCETIFINRIGNQSNPRCPTCYPIDEAIAKGWWKKSYDVLKEYYKDTVSFLFTVDEFKGASFPNRYNFKCIVCGNIFEDNMSSGKEPRCLLCNPRQNTSEMLLSKFYEILKNKYKDVVSFNFSKDEYKGSVCEYQYSLKCLLCNIDYLGKLSNGDITQCPKCFPRCTNQSAFEIEIRDYICSLIGKNGIIEKDKTILNGKRELDIYCPEYNFAVECNGVYWHSELSGISKKYHLDKTRECETKNIRLIHVLENEWIDKSDIVKSILQNILKPTNNIKIFARKCIIKEIDLLTTNNFLLANHLQGITNSSIRLGLFYNNELIQVLCLSKTRFNKKYEYEIFRGATKLFHVIVGGTEKLWNYFVKTYNPQSVLTYSDKRYFTGNSYLHLNFILDGYVEPTYFYFINSRFLENKMAFRKSKLKKNFPEQYDDSKTEWQIMQEIGYNRIWDCGLNRFVWKKKIDI